MLNKCVYAPLSVNSTDIIFNYADVQNIRSCRVISDFDSSKNFFISI